MLEPKLTDEQRHEEDLTVKNLRSAPPMVVLKHNNEQESCMCLWFGDDQQPHTMLFHHKFLEQLPQT